MYSKTHEAKKGLNCCATKKHHFRRRRFGSEPSSNTRDPGISYGYAHERSAEMLGNRGSGGVLSYLPAANAEQEPNDIGLLLLLDLFDVLEGTHLEQLKVRTLACFRCVAVVNSGGRGSIPCRLHEVVGCRCRNCEKFEGERSMSENVCGTLAISRAWFVGPIIGSLSRVGFSHRLRSFCLFLPQEAT